MAARAIRRVSLSSLLAALLVSAQDRASSAQSLSTTPSPASSSPAITSPPSTTAILSSSASSAAAAFPDFLMPEGNTQDCDIFGPYCQTGTINVPLNLTSTTTTTAVDCSYYLSAQSYTNQFITPYGGGPLYAVSPYVKSLGRSPECTAYAVDIEGPSADALYAKCDNSTGQLGPRDDYKPVGVWVRFNAALTYGCCGPCNFEADEIRVLYFPDEEAEAACSAQVGSNGTIIQSATSTQIPMGSTSVNLAIRAVTDVTASTTIYNGVTLTSPSVYVEIIGTARVSDYCGGVGNTLTNPIVAMNIRDLSTISVPAATQGAQYLPPMFDNLQNPWGTYSAVPVKLQDLICPTYGVGIANKTTTSWTSAYSRYIRSGTNSYLVTGTTTGSSTRVTYTFGPPFLPIIYPPSQLYNADPAWPARCGTDFYWYDYPYQRTFGIYDPPHPLTLQPPLSVPSSDPSNDPPITSLDPPPSSTGMALTTRPGPDPGPTPTKIPDTQPNPGNGGQNNPPGNGGQNDTPGGGDPNQGGGNNSGNNNPPNSDSGGNGGGGPQPGTGPITTWSPVTTVHIPGSPSGIPITVLPSGDGVIIDGHTLHPSNPAVTLPGGHVISASGNGVVVVDGSSITLGSGNNPGVGVNVISRGLNGEVQQAEITISGQTITMKPGEQSTVTGADGIATTVGLDPAGDVILSSSDGSGVLAPVTTTPGGDGSAVQTTGSSVRLEAGFPRVLGLLLTIVYIIA